MRATLSSLLDDITRMMNPFDLTKKGLAQEIATAAADGIIVHMTMGCEPDGTPWEPLSPGYQAWKDKEAPGQPIGRLYDHMMTYTQVYGTLQISTDQITQTYGVDDDAFLEALKFQRGGAVTGTTQPPRPFYGFTQIAVDRIDFILTRTFDAAIQ